MTHPVNWFSISGTDGQALMSFYKKVFGWKMDMMPGAEASGMVKPEAGGIPGDVSRSMNGGNQVTVYIGVSDIDAHMKKIQKAGGNPAMPKTQLPAGYGWIAQFTDPAGNAVGLWQVGAAMSAPAEEAPSAAPAPARRAKKAKPAKAEAPAMAEPKPAPAKKAAKAPKAAAKPAKAAKSAKPAAKPAKAVKSAKPAAKPAKAAKSAKPAAKPAKAAKAVKAEAAAKPAKPAKGAAKAKPKAKGRKA